MTKTENIKITWEKYNNLHWNVVYHTQDIQEEWESFILNLYKEKTNKTIKNVDKAYSFLIENECENMLAEKKIFFQEKIIKRKEFFEKEKDILKRELIEFAKNYTPPVSEEKHLLKKSYASNYHTQGMGASKYARGSLKEDFALLEILGYNPTIEQVGETRIIQAIEHKDYGLFAYLTEFDYDMIKMGGHFISILNWAVICWRNQVNPKVYFPFLEDEYYEKSLKLAYNNNYVITKDNMGEDL